MKTVEMWQRVQEKLEQKKERLRKKAAKEFFQEMQSILDDTMPAEEKLNHIQSLCTEYKKILLD